MATTKKINELNAAQSVAPTDKLALAQSAGGEAVAATVSQVAAAVAALNEEGALAELALATSAGKNLLAQRLSEKGVPTTASETLAQMADKVGGLVVDDGVEVLKGPVGYKMEGVSIPSAYNNYAFHILQNGDKIFWGNNKLYYIPDGDYDTFDEFIAAATAELDCAWPKKNGLCFDKNDEYFALFMGDKTFNIYQVNADAKTITLYKTLTVENTPYFDNFGTLYLLSGARFIIYAMQDPDNSYYGKAVAVNVETGDAVLSSNIQQSYSYSIYNCFLWEQNDNAGQVYLYNNSYNWAVRLNWQIEDGVFAWGDCNSSSVIDNLAVWTPRMDKFVRVYQQALSNNTGNLNYNKIRVGVYSPMGLELAHVDIPVIHEKYGDYQNVGFCRNNCVRVYQENGLWKIAILPFLPACTFDPATNHLTYDGVENYVPFDKQSSMYYSYYNYMCCLFSNKTKRTATGSYDNVTNYGMNPEANHYSGQLYKTSYTTTDKVTGFRRTGADGSVYVYPAGYITDETVQSGAMAIRTANLPLPGAEEEEA